ncbi:nuclear transport factor 2 family protein [Flavobacterium sp. LB3P122]|uniref:nuclear transport factor 2 family protein n=1 Tax=Flavobacterium algoriphilum TaxID=3398738 RepID=UPI003A849A48
MKKNFSIVLLIATSITFAQKKTNGTIYVEHPAINLVEAMTHAYVSGDADKVASFLADDFKSYNGVSSDKDNKGSDKASFLNEVKFWKDNVEYLSITRSQGAYPDALEYKEDTNKDVVWVQTWEDLKGVHSKTGVKIDMPFHRLFIVDKDNKIKTIIKYANNSIFDEIDSSFNDRENGVIYNHHENINNVRKMIYAFENKDFDRAYSFYDEKATFMDINSPVGKSLTLVEQKANDQKLFDKFDLTSIDMVGYPDYLHYEMGDAMVVQSWWNFKLTRKSDKKKIVLPIFFIDNFNDKGKITSEMAYYSEKMME